MLVKNVFYSMTLSFFNVKFSSTGINESFAASLIFMNGKPLRKLLLVMFMSVAIGGLNMLWYMYFTRFWRGRQVI